MFGKKDSGKKVLDIIIVGYGKVGSTLVESLSEAGNNVTIIDTNSLKVEAATDQYDIMGVVGNGASHSVLSEAGIDEADLVIAVTESDELNILCCIIANQKGNCSTIARVRTPDYVNEFNYLRTKLGLDMIINPEQAAADEAAGILAMPNALDVSTFAHGLADIIKFKVPEGNKLDGITVAELGGKIDNNIVICGVERNGEVHMPGGNFEMKAGDRISFVATRTDAKNFLEKIGITNNKIKDVLIVGGGRIAYYLAKQLRRNKINVKIIESDRARAEHLSEILPDVVIVNQDGSNQEVLRQNGIEDVDAVVALTGIDEMNVFITLYAKRASGNKAKVITKINHISFKEVIDQLDLGSIIYPKDITSEAIIKYVRGKRNSIDIDNIESLYYLFGREVEAVEFHVKNDSEVTNVPLKDMKLKQHLLISCISRKGKVIIPSGNECIMKGDMVMITTKQKGLEHIKDILA